MSLTHDVHATPPVVTPGEAPSPALEQAYLPSVEAIVMAVKKTLQ